MNFDTILLLDDGTELTVMAFLLWETCRPAGSCGTS
jgi:hypothetical protein